MSSEKIIEYLQAPFNIHVSQICNSFRTLEKSVILNKYECGVLNFSNLLGDVKNLNLEDKMINSFFFQECIDQIIDKLTNFKEDNKLNQDAKSILESFIKLLSIFKDIEQLDDDLFENSLEEFETVLDDVDFSKISEENDSDKICNSLRDISIGLYGIVGSFSNITDFRWKDLFVDNEKFADSISINKLILSQ